jgi:cytochrome P450
MNSIDFAIEELPNLHELLAQMNQQGPVSLINFAGKQIWLVTGFEELRQVMADDEYLSAPAAYQELLAPSMGEVLATMTGPRHRRNRSVVAKVFFPKKMRQLAETVFSDEAIKLAKSLQGRSELELVEDFTRPYTFNNITRLLGLPATDATLLRDWAERIMHSYIDLPAAISAKDEMGEYLVPIVAQRRASPLDDMISLLTLAEVEGEGLSDEEVFSFCRNLFPAAIDTSTNSLGSLLAVVLGDAKLRELALADDAAGREALVEELLRWEPPLVMVPRQCVKPLSLGGHNIQVGDDVRLCISAANNDPSVFVEPRRFDPQRENSNLAFGHGEHFCLGSHMARRVSGGVLRGPKAIWVTTGGG